MFREVRRLGESVFGASARREKGEDRVVELHPALRDSQIVSLRIPSGHHVEVEARRPPMLVNGGRACLPGYLECHLHDILLSLF